MKIHEVITEERRPDIKEQLLNAVRRDGGNLNEYFVRFTDIDKLGYSNRQWFGKTPDVDHPEFSVDYIGHSVGRRALWFYPLEVFLKRHHVYASEQPYVWLVRIKPDAWLQPVRSGDREVMPAPEGRERVGILRYSQVPAAIFFKPGFKLVERFYNYAWRHRRHGEVKGPPPPSFFDRIRGIS